MNEIILIVAEGFKSESQIIDNLKSVFFSNKVIIKILYGTSIYSFYKKKKLYGDDFETIEVLREMSDENKKILKGIKRRNVSSVFLFFDQDSHATNYSEAHLEEMLNFFDDEFENGKLFISYPMVEAIRDIDNLDEHYLKEECYWDINNNLEYKKYASEKIRNISFMSLYSGYDYKIWGIINRYNWTKTNLLLNDKFILPVYDELMRFTQKSIFEKQYLLIERYNKVITLSAFSLFISYYLKRADIEKILKVL